MSTTFQRFVITQSLGIATFNAGINALYTWGLWRSKSILTLFGENAIAFDLSSTSGWIAFLSTLLGTGAIRSKLRDGRVAAPRMRSTVPFDMLPRNIAARACILGLAGAIFLGAPVWLVLRASGIGDVSLSAAVLAKIAITLPMSFLIVPLIILAGLSDVQPGRRTAAVA